MMSFLKGMMFGLIIVSVILTSIRGLWWLFPAILIFGLVVDCVAKIITREFE